MHQSRKLWSSHSARLSWIRLLSELFWGHTGFWHYQWPWMWAGCCEKALVGAALKPLWATHHFPATGWYYKRLEWMKWTNVHIIVLSEKKKGYKVKMNIILILIFTHTCWWPQKILGKHQNILNSLKFLNHGTTICFSLSYFLQSVYTACALVLSY